MIKEQCPPPSTHSRPQRVGPPAEQIEIADHRDRVRQAPAVEHEPVAETDGGVVGAVEQVDEEGQEGQGDRAGENLWRVWSVRCHGRGNRQSGLQDRVTRVEKICGGF